MLTRLRSMVSNSKPPTNTTNIFGNARGPDWKASAMPSASVLSAGPQSARATCTEEQEGYVQRYGHLHQNSTKMERAHQHEKECLGSKDVQCFWDRIQSSLQCFSTCWEGAFRAHDPGPRDWYPLLPQAVHGRVASKIYIRKMNRFYSPLAFSGSQIFTAIQTGSSCQRCEARSLAGSWTIGREIPVLVSLMGVKSSIFFHWRHKQLKQSTITEQSCSQGWNLPARSPSTNRCQIISCAQSSSFHVSSIFFLYEILSLPSCVLKRRYQNHLGTTRKNIEPIWLMVNMMAKVTIILDDTHFFQRVSPQSMPVIPCLCGHICGQWYCGCSHRWWGVGHHTWWP